MYSSTYAHCYLILQCEPYILYTEPSNLDRAQPITNFHQKTFLDIVRNLVTFLILQIQYVVRHQYWIFEYMQENDMSPHLNIKFFIHCQRVHYMHGDTYACLGCTFAWIQSHATLVNCRPHKLMVYNMIRIQRLRDQSSNISSSFITKHAYIKFVTTIFTYVAGNKCVVA